MGLFQKKQPTTDADAEGRLAVEVETVRSILRRYAPGTRLTFGAPTRCPHCGDYGFVQGVNRADGVSYNHCFGCQADWIISIRALKVAHADPVLPGAPPPAAVVEASPWFAETMAGGGDDADDFDPAFREPGHRGVKIPVPAASSAAASSTAPTMPTGDRQPVAPIPASRPPAAPDHHGGAGTGGAEPVVPAASSTPDPSSPPTWAVSAEPTDPAAGATPAAPEPAEPVSTAPSASAIGASAPVAPASGAAAAHDTAVPARPASDPSVIDVATLAKLSRPGRLDAPAASMSPASASPASAAPAGPGAVVRIVVIEDNPFDLAVLEELVEFADPRVIELLPAATREEGERLAASAEHDLVLLDLDLPDSSGITTLLEWQHRAASHAPVIILSGSNDAAVIREARALGAVHFIQKDQLAELADAGAAGADRLARLLRTTVKRGATQPSA